MCSCIIATCMIYGVTVINRSAAVAYSDTGYPVSLSAKESEKNSMGTSSSTTVSLLDQIQTPCLSELSCKQKVHTSPPPQEKHPSLWQGDCSPNSVSPTKRTCEFLSNGHKGYYLKHSVHLPNPRSRRRKLMLTFSIPTVH